MATMTLCDKCGTVIQDKKNQYHLELKGEKRMSSDPRDPERKRQLCCVLCPVCAREVVSFVKYVAHVVVK